MPRWPPAATITGHITINSSDSYTSIFTPLLPMCQIPFLSLISYINPMKNYYYSHFIGEETKAQRGVMTLYESMYRPV